MSRFLKFTHQIKKNDMAMHVALMRARCI